MLHAAAFDTTAHQLLEELEVRHDQLLAEIDALDARVDAVLAQYTQARSEIASATIESSDDE